MSANITDHGLTHLLDIPTEMSCDSCGDLVCDLCVVNDGSDTLCGSCGALVECVACQQPTRTYQLSDGECGYHFAAPGICPSCVQQFLKDRDMDRAGSSAAWKGDA